MKPYKNEVENWLVNLYQVGILGVFAFDYGLQDFRLHIRITVD